MTREETIKKQAEKEVTKTYAFIHHEDFSCEDMADMFVKGGKWADEHPRKNLVDIDEAVRWLKDNAGKFVYLSAHTNLASINAHLLAEEFAKEI